MNRLAVLVSHPIEYFVPLFQEVARQPGIDMMVYFGSRFGIDEMTDPGFGQAFKWDTPLLDGYRSVFLAAIQADVGPAGFWRPFNPTIMNEFLKERYDAVWIHGHYSATNLLAMLAAKVAGTKVMLRSESNLESLPRSPIIRLIKHLALKVVFSFVDRFLYIGERNKAYYRYYGVPEERLFFAPYVVDNDFFQAESQRLESERASIRASFGIIDNSPIILFVGKLIPKKRPLMLLDAFAKIRERFPCVLVFAGDGELRELIEQKVFERSISDVHVTGFLNQTEMPEAYTAGDILVLPSSWDETWGLVVNEGMNFGLPIIVTDRVGCCPDLVREGENGYITSNDNKAALTSAIAYLVENSQERYKFGCRSREIIQDWDLESCAQGIVRASLDTQETR